MVEAKDLYAGANSRIEGFVLRRLCNPILVRLPPSLNPNTLTIINHIVCWACLVFAAAAPVLSTGNALAARIMAGVLIAVSMVLDCLDGLHARRTGQTSRVGEVLDHWLDGLNTPLNTAAMVLTLGLDPWTATACMASLAMSYGGQLIVWHHTGKFLCSPTCGVEAQFLLALSFIGAGLFFFIFPPATHPEVGYWGALTFGWVCIMACLKQIYWFARQAPSVAVYNIRIGLLIFAIGLLYPFGMMSEIGAVLVMGLVSFRLTGSYVLYTVLGRRYEGLDWITLMWIPIIVCVHLFIDPLPVAGTTLHECLPYLVCLHVAGATVLDLIRHFDELRFIDDRVSSDSA